MINGPNGMSELKQTAKYDGQTVINQLIKQTNNLILTSVFFVAKNTSGELIFVTKTQTNKELYVQKYKKQAKILAEIVNFVAKKFNFVAKN